MQGILISEKILHQQICTVCKKYLSHGPITITTKEGVKCGRCSAERDIGVISNVNSVFESVIFPCVNRYEGCSQLLKFQDVPKHEKTCIGQQYLCPLCPEAQYGPNSILFLLNHYRNFHKSEIISDRFIIIVDIEVRKEHTYLYCNDLESMVVFINIKFTGERLSISPSTIIVNSNKVEYNVFLVEDGCQKYYGTGEVSGPFGLIFNTHEVDLETLSLKNCTTSVLCIFDFHVVSAFKVISLPKEGNNKLVPLKKNNAICIESYFRSQNNFTHPSYPKKCPDIYTSGISTYMEKMKIKDCGEYYAFVHFEFNNFIVWSLICKLCENYFATSGPYTNIYECSGQSICGVCFHNGLKYCKIKPSYVLSGLHNNNYSITIDIEVGKVLYWCRYNCKSFFKGGELSIHEKQCHLNTEEHLDDETFGMRHFGNYFCINSDDSKSLILRSNVVKFNLDDFGSNKGRIYMVTECFKCILFYEIDKSLIRFRAAHQYFPDKYYIEFKVVKCGLLPEEEEVNSFSINFVENEHFFFCVFLRKIEQ